MYKFSDNQLKFSDFGQPVGMKMNSENRWVKKAALIPWEEIEKRYAKLFTYKKGNVAKAIRLALGALIIQTAYGYSGEETARKRRKSVKDIRKAIGKQLRYMKRDFGYIDHMLKQRKRLSPKLEKLLQV